MNRLIIGSTRWGEMHTCVYYVYYLIWINLDLKISDYSVYHLFKYKHNYKNIDKSGFKSVHTLHKCTFLHQTTFELNRCAIESTRSAFEPVYTLCILVYTLRLHFRYIRVNLKTRFKGLTSVTEAVWKGAPFPRIARYACKRAGKFDQFTKWSK